MPVVTLGLASGLLHGGLRRKIVPREAAVFLVMASLLICPYAFCRCDATHLFPLFALNVALCCLMLTSWAGAAGPRSAAGRALTCIVTGLCAMAAWTTGLAIARHAAAIPVPLARARGIVFRSEDELREHGWLVAATRWLRDGDDRSPIFVGCSRHDLVSVNPMLLYFLSGRAPASYFYQFDPGLTTTAPVQARIVSDLERARVETAALWRRAVFREPNPCRFPSGVTLLDDYLRDHFVPERSTDDAVWLRRRPDERQPSPPVRSSRP